VISDLCNQGKEMLLVTSGAIAAGADSLRLEHRPRDIPGKQAASAVGQAILMQIYQRFFSLYNRQAAQILLTSDVLDNPIRKQNASNTINTLLSMGVVPIINANDTITTEEINEISDNDTLSARVTVLTESNLLIMLSDTEGLYNVNPRSAPQAALYYEVNTITPDMLENAGEAGTTLGTGGMATKLNAVQILMGHNIDSLLAQGEDPGIIWRILEGERLGTYFSKGD